MGVTECDNMLMLLGVSNKMSEKVRSMSVNVLSFHFVRQITAKKPIVFIAERIIITISCSVITLCTLTLI